MSEPEEKKIVDPMAQDKRYTKEYEEKLIQYANNVVKPEEREIYKDLYDTVKEVNQLDKPQDLMMLDMAIYDFLRTKRLQKLLTEDGDVLVTTSRSGKEYKKVNEASYLLNAVETQFRNMMKEIGLTGKERIKQKLGVDSKDFASFMSEPVEVIAEEVKDEEVTNEKRETQNNK